MENSPLQTLPREIRDYIYELVFAQDGPVVIICVQDSGFERAVDEYPQRNILALTETCHALRSECGLVFYAINTFAFPIALEEVDRVVELLQRFDLAIGPLNTAALRSVVVDLDRPMWLSGVVPYALIQAALTTLITGLQTEAESTGNAPTEPNSASSSPMATDFVNASRKSYMRS